MSDPATEDGGWNIRHLPDTPLAFVWTFIQRYRVAYAGMLGLQRR
ncbi:hypothetical protein NRB16_22140 [Pseudomonas sp. LJDD11]|nr:hypothetical protein [Pseudomonas sp. LJDD11]MCQ9426224.1 hypothetical protein [Pseudomonas sp. LJDD11]